MEFKKGDKIEAVIDYPSDGEVRKGEIGVIEKEPNYIDNYVVNFPSQSTYLIPFEEIQNTSKYKKVVNHLNVKEEDYLVVIKDIMFHAVQLKEGDFIKIGKSDKWIHSRYPSSTYLSLGRYPSDIFREVTPKEKLEAIENIKKDNFSIGDTIKVVTHSSPYFPYGTLLTVTEGIDNENGFEARDSKGEIQLLTANQGYYAKIDNQNPSLPSNKPVEDLSPIPEFKSRNITIDRSEQERIVGIIPTKHIIINR